MTNQSETTYAERLSLFHETFDFEVDASVTIAHLVRAAGDFLACIVKPEDLDKGMNTLIGGLMNVSERPINWRDALEENESYAYSEWPIGDKLHHLSAYAHYGIYLSHSEDDTPEHIEKQVGDLIRDLEQFLRVCPLEQWLGDERAPQFEQTLTLARNRWALDNDSPVELDALALFGGVSVGRVRNMTNGPEAVFSKVNGLVPAHEATTWLHDRKSFFPSIWKEPMQASDAKQHDNPKAHDVVGPLFVPQARDGSVFHPGLLRGQGYRVGPKDNECSYADFDAALAELQQMSTPYWRRPSSSSPAWGIVAGVNWIRMSKEDLDGMARSFIASQKVG